jgi:superfamily II DNA or RNA helicase
VKYANGKRAVAFCCSIEHARLVAAAFREASICSATIDGNMHRDVRRRMILEFRSGVLKVITSCDVLSEGLDIPAIECALILRPSMSLAWHIQAMGRAIRPYPGKTHAVILDHAGNTARHGFIDDDRTWSLDKSVRKKKSASSPSVKICSNCFAAQRPGSSTCGICQVEFPVKPRKVLQLEGDLVEFRKSPERAHEEAMCHTLKDWHVLAKKLGYKSGWAFAKWNRRFG